LVLLPKYYSYDQIKKNAMGRECGIHGIAEKYIQGFVGKIEAKTT